MCCLEVQTWPRYCCSPRGCPDWWRRCGGWRPPLRSCWSQAARRDISCRSQTGNKTWTLTCPHCALWPGSPGRPKGLGTRGVRGDRLKTEPELVMVRDSQFRSGKMFLKLISCQHNSTQFQLQAPRRDLIITHHFWRLCICLNHRFTERHHLYLATLVLTPNWCIATAQHQLFSARHISLSRTSLFSVTPASASQLPPPGANQFQS